MGRDPTLECTNRSFRRASSSFVDSQISVVTSRSRRDATRSLQDIFVIANAAQYDKEGGPRNFHQLDEILCGHGLIFLTIADKILLNVLGNSIDRSVMRVNNTCLRCSVRHLHLPIRCSASGNVGPKSLQLLG